MKPMDGHYFVLQVRFSLFFSSNRSICVLSDLINSSIYTYFIDNQRTVNHQSVIFGLRELNSTEASDSCSNIFINSPPISSKPFNFTANYNLRVYTSGCYYMDENNSWQSDGLLVGSATNHHQTQCYSIH